MSNRVVGMRSAVKRDILVELGQLVMEGQQRHHSDELRMAAVD